MKKLIGIIATAILLAGCTSSQPVIEASEAPSKPTYENIWQQKCAEFSPRNSQPWHPVYNEIIADVCENTVLSDDVLEVIYSPLVNQERLEKFIQTAFFSFSYWKPITADTAPVKLILITEKEEQWWRETMAPLVKDPAVLEWFGPEAKGVGRCWSIGPDAGCGAKYPVWETTTGTLVYVNVLGTQRMPDNEYNIDAAHNAPHWYQDSHGYQHWDDGFLEGHATLYEIAFHILYTGSDKKREDGAWSARGRDGLPFTARTPEDALAHIENCRKNENGPACNHFFYFGGAMQQEKMIIDFGYDTYLKWHEAMRSVRSSEEYAATFKEVYGVDLRQWQATNFAEYLAESFDYYITKWGV